MPASPGPPLSPSTFSSAQSSLLRLSRRHSLPASAGLSGILSFLGNASPPATPGATRHRNLSDENERAAAAVGIRREGGGAGGGVGDRHRYGHRHTRSEAYDQPVIVKNYNPGPAALAPEPIKEVGYLLDMMARNTADLHALPPPQDDEADVSLPTVDDFSFVGILKAVDPQVGAALDGVTELCVRYQDTVRTEVDSLTNTQADLDTRNEDVQKFAARVLKGTKARVNRLDTENASLKGGAAVEAVAEATEATYTVLTSIVSTLLAIDEMLPPQERLSPETSPHRNHYPRLHTLLVGKATELNLCFGRSNGNKRPSTSIMSPTSTADGAATPRNLPLRRRMSSSSQILLAAPGLDCSSGSRAPPPQLQLKTILPSSNISSPKVVESTDGSYFPLAPQTATGISLTHSNGRSSSSSGAAPKRGSEIWGSKASNSTLALFSFDEGAGMRNVNTVNIPQPPPTSGKSFSWRRSNGSWSGFAGFWGGRSSRGSSGEQGRRDRAEDKLKKVLQGTEAVGKGKKVLTSSW